MIFDRSQKKKCRDCKGSGLLEKQVGTSQHSHKTCPSCNGTGKYTDEYFVIEANGIAIDSDFAGK